MNPALKPALDELLQRHDLDLDIVRNAFSAIMDGECEDAEIAALLTALAVKGESETEIAGAAQAMRSRACRIPTTRTGLLDTCGTGGDGLSTFNISTATAIVAAAAGVPVAKHGNRKASSSSGSADVLESLGVNIELSAAQAAVCLDEIDICFCYARLLHGAMKHVAGVRSQLGIRTIFNFLGPLTNPAQAEFQLLGANRIATARKLAGAASKLEIGRVLVVCGNDQLDEVSLWGEVTVFDVHLGRVEQSVWTTADFGLSACTPGELVVHSAEESANVIRGLLAGEPGPARDMVVANTAAALLCAGVAERIRDGVELAEATIDSGRAQKKLEKLAELTQQIAVG
ncbi:MAG: anthranilate phosphoribosyltransferase [Planctomycetaceae bacterium]